MFSSGVHIISVSSFYRPYWRCYYANTDAIIYVVDSVDRERMGISKSELHAMLEVSTLCILVGIHIHFVF